MPTFACGEFRTTFYYRLLSRDFFLPYPNTKTRCACCPLPFLWPLTATVHHRSRRSSFISELRHKKSYKVVRSFTKLIPGFRDSSGTAAIATSKYFPAVHLLTRVPTCEFALYIGSHPSCPRVLLCYTLLSGYVGHVSIPRIALVRQKKNAFLLVMDAKSNSPFQSREGTARSKDRIQAGQQGRCHPGG